ncbi:hypothetical protein AVEN_3278-1 [Araneus ventricosus]|uniref:RNase H type-1 domain-containing protein n=1 Tax=Araneus ventricosus TaxID=182803 RepID=A0A4Y2M244_ARAVE|nr:hypothetical protein AVEN_3278-1 [Araneus ventricosus]
MLCHGANIWAENLTEKIKRKLSSVQRKFLLSIISAYHTTATSSLQTITGIPPLHLIAHKEAKYFKLTKLREQTTINSQPIDPNHYELMQKGHQIHPVSFNIDSQISTKEANVYPTRNSTFTDGSKNKEGTGSAFCYLDTNEKITKEWQGQLHQDNIVFQAELLAIQQAISFHLTTNSPVQIWTDSLSSLQAIENPTSPHPLVKEIQHLLHQNNLINLGWIKAHVGHKGNESADHLAKKAITEGIPTSILKPLSHLKKLLNQELLYNWKKEWDKTETGRLIHKIIPTPTTKNHNWDRREIMFLTEHGPFTSFLKRFKLRSSDKCSCGETGTPLHFATSCPFTKQWHFSKPSNDFGGKKS